MWLTIQIAAGIVLAYVIIQHGTVVWKYGVFVAIVVAALLTFSLVGTLASDALSPYGGVGAILNKMLKFVGLILAMMVGWAGIWLEGRAIATVSNRLFRRDWNPSEIATNCLGVANLFFTGAALQGFNLTDSGPIMGPIDAYGRAHGFYDGLTLIAWFVFSLWIVPIGFWLGRTPIIPAQTDEGE